MKVQGALARGVEVMGSNFNLICPINVEAASNLSFNQSRSGPRPRGSKPINPAHVISKLEQLNIRDTTSFLS